MAKFEKVSKYTETSWELPKRATALSAGYDLTAVEEVVIPPLDINDYRIYDFFQNIGEVGEPVCLDDIAELTKHLQARPSLVSTGVKCKLANDEYLKIASRSSIPYKTYLIIANGVGTIDADYYNNPDNEGEIFVQFINLSSVPLKIRPGEKIAQGIIGKYYLTEDDEASGDRTGGFGSTDEQ